MRPRRPVGLTRRRRTLLSSCSRGKLCLGVSFEECGRQRAAVMAELKAMRGGDADWRGGRVPLYVFSGPPDDFAKFVVAETDKWAKVIKFANIKAD